jgi:hypothetical protein
MGKAGDPLLMSNAESILRDAVVRVLAKDYHLSRGAYGVGWNTKRGRWSPQKGRGMRMCPIGATVVVHQPPVPKVIMERGRYDKREITTGSVPAAAAAALGVDIEWIRDFMLAFDGILVTDTDAGKLGAAIHEEYC